MKIIDAHSHIEYITHNFQHDVVGAICCTKNESEWEVLCNIMNDDDCVYGAFGVHPWYIKDVDKNFNLRLQDLLKSNPKYMIGEIGLDKYKPDMENQIEVFIKQLNIAIKLHRSVFLHCVGAWDKILHILKQYKQSELPIMVVHGFNENQYILDALLQYDNIMFSFNKIDVYGRKYRIEQIVNNKILVETDGKSDVCLCEIIHQISNVKNESDIDKIIFNNTLKVISNE